MIGLGILGGLVLLFAGGEGFVRGATALASRLGVSPFVIGVTLVGFGTSLPELVASVKAALVGAPGIAIGNVVGSNIANILLILGLAALLCPFAVDAGILRRDGGMVAVSTATVLALLMTGAVDAMEGGVLLVALLAYTGWTLHRDRKAIAADRPRDPGTANDGGPGRPRLLPNLVFVGVALAAVILGADLLVDDAIALAAWSGVPEAVIGVTIVAIGTSLPELAVSIVAAWRGQSAMALGNILGSNVFNLLGILGVTALVRPLPVPPELMGLDAWALAAATAAVILFAATGLRVTRGEGAALLAGYGGYIGLHAAAVT